MVRIVMAIFRGNPDKTDYYGNTALHIAAAKGHMQCVDFLVKFGVNLYAKDIERHNAKVDDKFISYLLMAVVNLYFIVLIFSIWRA